MCGSAPVRRPWCGRHQVGEPPKEVAGVVGTRRRLRVILHAEHRQLAVPQPLAGGVVEVEMARLEPAGRHRRGIDGEVVILRGDLDAAGGEVTYRVVRAVMTERQLVGPATGGQADD